MLPENLSGLKITLRRQMQTTIITQSTPFLIKENKRDFFEPKRKCFSIVN